MGLKTDAAYAQELVDALIDLDPEGFGAQDSAIHDSVRDVLGTAIATLVLSALADATITISGTDSAGDTPDGLTAAIS